MSKYHAACPDHVPCPVVYVITELSGQGVASARTSAALLVEDVGETLASRCQSLCQTALLGECDVMVKEWLWEIVAMTNEVGRKELPWHQWFDTYGICWNHRTRRWYFSEFEIDGEVLSFVRRWFRAARYFRRSARHGDPALIVMSDLIELRLTNQYEPMPFETPLKILSDSGMRILDLARQRVERNGGLL